MTLSFFFFNDTATTEIYTLSLHDALPISASFQRQHESDRVLDLLVGEQRLAAVLRRDGVQAFDLAVGRHHRSEEHTSELQSRPHLVCRLLLEKKKHNLWRHDA